MDTKPAMCCFLECDQYAEWEICYGETVDDYTHACTKHVGIMLEPDKRNSVYPVEPRPPTIPDPQVAALGRDVLWAALGAIMDCVDYTSGACTQTEMVGAVLPRDAIANAKAVLEASDEHIQKKRI